MEINYEDQRRKRTLVERDDGQRINQANGLNADGSSNVRMLGSNVTDYGPVTPNNSTELAGVIGVMVAGNPGALSVMKPNGQIVIIPAAALPVGVILPLPVRRIRLTDTTATGIWAVYG